MFSLKNVSPTITDMIRFDHSHVMLTWHQYVSTKTATVKKALAETICDALEIHATLEEEIFYPTLRQLGIGGHTLGKSEPEHNEMRAVIARIRSADPESSRYDQLVAELMRDVIKHVADEETVLLPDAERLLSSERLSALGVQMTKRRAQLLAPKAGKIAASTVVGFSSSTTALVGAAVGALLLGRAISKRATS
ncbi:MAG: cation-binding protein [Massilia sp.]|jgi:hemerythrin superfamily protein|nr:cation-binding protein [Massilia sp.]